MSPDVASCPLGMRDWGKIAPAEHFFSSGTSRLQGEPKQQLQKQQQQMTHQDLPSDGIMTN